jgi:xanthine dehydrogenase YagT iron-sulfur-binding subunit
MARLVEVTRRTVVKSAGLVAAAVGVRPTLGAASPREAQSAATGARLLTTPIKVNGVAHSVNHEPRVTLLDLLREQLDLTGTKKGCNEGACGACTVLLDGKRVNACMVLAASCAGREVTTVEGLAGADGALHAVQQAFIDQDAFQCGYCTSGQIISAVACVREGHTGSDTEIAEWMSGNLCRCAAYPQIVAAVKQATAQLSARG